MRTAIVSNLLKISDSLIAIAHYRTLKAIYGTIYSIMDQVKFAEDSL